MPVLLGEWGAWGDEFYFPKQAEARQSQEVNGALLVPGGPARQGYHSGELGLRGA